MSPFAWNDSYSVGNTEVDNHHQRLPLSGKIMNNREIVRTDNVLVREMALEVTYQKKAMQDVRVDAKKPEPAVPSPPEQVTPESSTPPVKQKRVAKKAKQYHRGKLLTASETTDTAKMREGCYLHFSIQPGGVNVPWNPASYQSGVMKMDVQSQSACLQDCMDNAQQKSLDAAKGWILYGRCNYFGEKIWSNEKTK